jgi:hypothetical protein
MTRHFAFCLRVFLALILLLTWSAAPSNAQDYPRWEAFTGFSYAHANLGGQTSLFQPTDQNYYGMHVNASFNPTRFLRIVMCDFGVQIGGTTANLYPEKGDLRTSQALFGPEFVYRGQKSAWFAHTLIGVTNTRLVGTLGGRDVVPDVVNRTNLAFGVGGGVDFHLNHLLAVRAIEADYVPNLLSSQWEKHFRVSTGVVFTLGYKQAR